MYQGGGKRFVYVPGVGWAEPLGAELPPPQEGLFPLEALKALGHFRVPEAGVRFGEKPKGLRVVLDLPAPYPAEPREERGKAGATLYLPYLAPDLLKAPWPKGLKAKVRLLPEATELALRAEQGHLYYRLFPSEDPRLVLDLYLLAPEVEEVLAPGVRYREVYGFTPEPLRLYLVEAERGRLLPVGTPGKRALPKDLAPGALAVLNGGYFDPKSGTPIGLWVQDGVTLSYPYGRVALLWDGFAFFLGFPQFVAEAVGPDGSRVRVGVNASRARYTAHTVPGLVGREGEGVALVREDRVVALLPPRPSFPRGTGPSPSPGMPLLFPSRWGRLALYGTLNPPSATPWREAPSSSRRAGTPTTPPRRTSRTRDPFRPWPPRRRWPGRRRGSSGSSSPNPPPPGPWPGPSSP